MLATPNRRAPGKGVFMLSLTKLLHYLFFYDDNKPVSNYFYYLILGVKLTFCALGKAAGVQWK